MHLPQYFRALIFSASVWIGTGSSGHAATAGFQGASALIEDLLAQKATPQEKTNVSDAATLREDLTRFRTNSLTLAPDVAAAQWLELMDRSFNLPSANRFSRNDTVPFGELLSALPDPKSWDAIKRLAIARPATTEQAKLRESALRLILAVLTADPSGRAQEIQTLQGLAAKADRSHSYQLAYVVSQLAGATIDAMEDPEAILSLLEKQVISSNRREGYNARRIPNLVSIVGKEKAEAFLRKALVQSAIPLDLPEGTPTEALGRKLALELVDQLKVAPWNLVNSIDSVELFEALEKKFPKHAAAATNTTADPIDAADLLDAAAATVNRDSENREVARAYYLLGLIAKGRTSDAVKVARGFDGTAYGESIPHGAIVQMKRAGYTHPLEDFLHELLTQDPALPFWDHYILVAAHAGKTDRMLELANKSIARTGLTPATRTKIRSNLYKMLLAADRVEEAGIQIQQVLTNSVGKVQWQEKSEIALLLARVGQLLERPEWRDQGIRLTRQEIEDYELDDDNWSLTESISALAQIMGEAGQGQEAELLLREQIREGLSRNKNTRYSRPKANTSLLALARLYYNSGRHEDVVTLLDKAPFWGISDLISVQGGISDALASMPGKQTSIPYLAIFADSLARVGRTREASDVTEYILETNPESDLAYSILIRLKGTNSIEMLDQIFSRNQFEERPLIWKGELLRQQGRFAEAEAVLKKAIAIDPSDGEQGPGDRMRVYAVLAEVRQAQGDVKEADFLRGVVQAIRLSEQADKFYSAGLLKRAVAMYEESLKHFSDAYCIQSRLAIQLSNLGMVQEAEAHYQKAYELMPDSFGRVESHCFGCEKAFEGERAQSIAEKVFTNFAAKTPNKPQVHYLLGYLREEQGRHEESLPLYRKAVALDPDYLNAWLKLEGLSDKVPMSATERDQIVLNLLRIVPQQRRSQIDASHVTDLRALWTLLAAAQKNQPPVRTNLFKLPTPPAATAVSAVYDESLGEMYGSQRHGQKAFFPGSVIAANRFIAPAVMIIDQLSDSGE